MHSIPWRYLSQQIVVLSLLWAAALTLFAQVAAAQALADPMSTLIVAVQLSPGGARRSPTPQVGTQVLAAAVSDGSATPVATAVTDDTGAATLSLPAGTYWLFVPAAPPERITVAQRSLPNGTATSGWVQVDLAPGQNATASITLANLAP